MDTNVIRECKELSFADTPFPEIANRLAGAGVRSYRADLIRLRKDYYGEENESFDLDLPLANAPAIGDRFDSERVSRVVKSIQRREIGYSEFLRRIMAAGCASYSVFIGGRKAIYSGKDGDCYTENFPPVMKD